MKQKIRQIIYELRRQPLISGVTFVATVLSVFLFMVVMITQRVKTIPFAPESCRERLLVGKFLHLQQPADNGDASSGMSTHVARTLYDGLKGVEHISFMYGGTLDRTTRGTEKNSFQTKGRWVDSEFFKVFDHQLLAGRYFTKEEAATQRPIVVISESTARKAFGKTDCTGQQISLNHVKYTVVGVVKDNSPLATTAYGDLFVAYSPQEEKQQSEGIDYLFGNTEVALVMKPGVSAQSIRDQVKARYAIIDTEAKPRGWRTVYHEAPFDQETLVSGMFGSNNTPDTSGSRKMRWFLYAVLLIVPAINLSSLLHSRMRRRVNEIGVRRAYGCTRRRIIRDIITENFLITLVGGIVGVALGVLFAMTYSGLYESMDTYGSGITPALGSVLNWGTVIVAVAVCFILNIISASIPAWQASRLNPVDAINSK